MMLFSPLRWIFDGRRDNMGDHADLSYNIFAFTGDQDIAFPALDAQIKAMIADDWNSDADHSVRYGTWAEGTHCYQYIYQYIYNILPDVF